MSNQVKAFLSLDFAQQCFGGLGLRNQPSKHNGNNRMVRHNNRRNSRTKLPQRKTIDESAQYP